MNVYRLPCAAALPAAAVVACVGAASAQPAPLPQIWLHMMPYTESQVDGKEGWKTLFAPGSAWPGWMKQVGVISIASDWYGAGRFPPAAMMRAAAAKLAPSHIAFATTSLAQSWVDEPPCGQGVESYTDPPGDAKVALRLRALGFNLAYITMDEPLWFGHYYTGPNSCNSSIENTAQRAAAIMRQYTRVFPDVVIGENEPLTLVAQPGWQSDYAAWQLAFRQALGRPISFLRADIQWNDPAWPAKLGSMAGLARSQHLPIGIIYNADLPSGVGYDPPLVGNRTTQAQESANQLWLDGALANITEIEEENGLIPDQAVFESWSTLPIRTVTTSPSPAYPLGRPGEDFVLRNYLALHGIGTGP